MKRPKRRKRLTYSMRFDIAERRPREKKDRRKTALSKLIVVRDYDLGGGRERN